MKEGAGLDLERCWGERGRESMSTSADEPGLQGSVEAVSRTGCPALNEWHDLLHDRTAGPVRDTLERHLDECLHCLETLAVLAEGEAALNDPARPTPRPVSAETLPESSREMLARLAEPKVFRQELADLARSQPLPQIEGLSELSEVGRGGTGVVYRAHQESTNRWVAVKLLSLGPTRQGVARILREANLLGRLRHPHVVTIYGSGVCQGTPYLTMEWLSGGTLQRRIEERPVSVAQAVQWGIHLAQAVAAAHAMGIVHRDLKPANVLLEPAPERGQPELVKLTDFGLADDLASDQRLTLSGQVLGTPHYMAPEQTGLVPGLGSVGPACDVYGLGAILFTLLAGQPPHGGLSTSQTLLQVAQNEPRPVNGLRREVSPDLATIVAKCLRHDPAQRYASARELADDLERFRRGLPILARPYTGTERLLKWIRRRPMTAVALGLLTVLVVGGAWSTVELKQASRELQSAQEEQKLAAIRLGETEKRLGETRDEQRKAEQKLRHLLRQLSTVDDQLKQRQSSWIKQTGQLHDKVDQMVTLLGNASTVKTEEQWVSLVSFREQSVQELQSGMYDMLPDPELRQRVAKLLLSISYLWEQRFAAQRNSRDLDEAQRCLEVVELVFRGDPAGVESRALRVESLVRWLRLQYQQDFSAPPGREEWDRAQQLVQLLTPTPGVAPTPLKLHLISGSLTGVGWASSPETALELGEALIAESAEQALREGASLEDWQQWIARLNSLLFYQIDEVMKGGWQVTCRQVTPLDCILTWTEFDRVLRQAGQRFPEQAAGLLESRLLVLRHWSTARSALYDAGLQAFTLPRWREDFFALLLHDADRAMYQFSTADRLIPREARMLRQQGRVDEARQMLTEWLDKVEILAPAIPDFPWDQSRAIARISLARLELAQADPDKAEALLQTAIQQITRWLSDPQVSPQAYETWFEARFTQAEHRRPRSSPEALHRELVDLAPHCPKDSRPQFTRLLVPTALAAGNVDSAIKAIGFLEENLRTLRGTSRTPVWPLGQTDQDSSPELIEVGEEVGLESLNDTLRELLPKKTLVPRRDGVKSVQ